MRNVGDITTSIVIPTHNNFEVLAQCLHSIQSNCRKYEIVVVDNGSFNQKQVKKYIETLGARNIKLIELDENKGYGQASNIGAEQATGDNILFLNDDTKLFGESIPAMTSHLYEEKAFIQSANKIHEIPHKNVGMVGPMSNFSFGLQHLDITEPHNFKKAWAEPHHYAAQFYQNNQGRCMPASMLSGFCLLVKRELYDKLLNQDGYFFNPVYGIGGYEDNDVCLRSQYLGYKHTVAADAYVWHAGNQTINKYFPFQRGGLANEKRFYKEWLMRRSSPPVLVIIHRVKIENQFFKEMFYSTLKYSTNTADAVLVLDDNSPVKWFDKLDTNKIDINKLKIKKCGPRDFDERRDRNMLINWAYDEGKHIRPKSDTWIFSIDSDEVPESLMTRSQIDRLIRPTNPQVQAYWLTFWNFWSSWTHVRTDDTFKTLAGIRLWNQMPNNEIVMGNEQGFHCGNAPIFPGANIRYTSWRIKHYGYKREEDQNRKATWYNQFDQHKDPVMIGHYDYEHCRAKKFELTEWVEKNRISACMIVRNEGEYLGNLLSHLIPATHEVNVVDCRSKDDTREMCKLFGVNYISLDDWCIRNNKNPDDYMFPAGEYKDWLTHIGEARNIAKSLASVSQEEWILMVDGDENFHDDHGNPEWNKLVWMVSDPRIYGYIFKVANYQSGKIISRSDNVRLYRNYPEFQYDNPVHESFEKITRQRSIRGKTMTWASMILRHYGYLRNPHFIDKKLSYYSVLNRKMMQENPGDHRPYFNEALHLMNRGDDEGFIQGLMNLIHACRIDPGYYPAQKELLMTELKILKRKAEFIRQQPAAQDQNMQGFYQELINFVNKFAGDDLRVGSMRTLNQANQRHELHKDMAWN